MAAVLRTDRLRLRGWLLQDRAPFARLNSDPEVMRHFPSGMTSAESNAMVDRIEQGFAENGFGLWAVETGQREFIGFVGLSVPTFEAPFMPCVEIGWRVATAYQGRGYATEAARRCLSFAFEEAGSTKFSRSQCLRIRPLNG